MMERYECSVVTPFYNQVHLTKRCLQSMFSGAQKKHEVIWVNNGSSDETQKTLEGFRDRFSKEGWKIEIIQLEKNQGFAKAVNLGIKKASAPYVFVLSNDTWLMSGWDQALLSSIQELQADMVGPYYDETVFAEEKILDRAKKFTDKYSRKFKKRWVSVAMLFDRSVFERVGYFDEEYFLTFEDRDFRHRMDLERMKYYQVGSCYLWHHSKGTRASDPKNEEYEKRGLSRFVEKWGFDPRAEDHTVIAKLKRKWDRYKDKNLIF